MYSIFNKWKCRKWTSLFNKMILDLHFTLCKKKPKWIIDINVKCKTVNILEENMWEIVSGFDFGKISLAITLKLQSIKEKMINSMSSKLIILICEGHC